MHTQQNNKKTFSEADASRFILALPFTDEEREHLYEKIEKEGVTDDIIVEIGERAAPLFESPERVEKIHKQFNAVMQAYQNIYEQAITEMDRRYIAMQEEYLKKIESIDRLDFEGKDKAAKEYNEKLEKFTASYRFEATKQLLTLAAQSPDILNHPEVA